MSKISKKKRAHLKKIKVQTRMKMLNLTKIRMNSLILPTLILKRNLSKLKIN